MKNLNSVLVPFKMFHCKKDVQCLATFHNFKENVSTLTTTSSRFECCVRNAYL